MSDVAKITSLGIGEEFSASHPTAAFRDISDSGILCGSAVCGSFLLTPEQDTRDDLEGDTHMKIIFRLDL